MPAVIQQGRTGLKSGPPVSVEVAVRCWVPGSACPEGHPLPMRPTRWFDGIAWRDGREVCRHCYEEPTAMDRATRAYLQDFDHYLSVILR
jgi:hypothetical protein